MLSILGVYGAAALHAQTATCGASFECPQGSSFSFDFGQYFSQINGEISGTGFTYSFSFALGGGTLPPGLTVTPSGLISGTLTTAGTYNFSLNFTEALTYQGATVFSETVPFPLSFIVTPYSGPQVTVDPPGLNFNLTQGGTAATESINISNFTGQTAQFSATVATGSGGTWLSASPSSGSAASFGSSSVVVTADPTHLTPGTYSGTVMISITGGQSYSISVLAVVSSNQPVLLISQTGATFQAVAGGTATSPQTIGVLNPGGGTLNFSAAASTISGGNWLSVTPSSGSSTFSSFAVVTVSVNPAGLQPGTYYGTIQFSASGAANSPQVATVVLNVVSPANSPGAFVQPTGLIFVGVANGANPAARTIAITNPSPNALSYLTTAFSNGSTNGPSSGPIWFSAIPSSGMVSASQPATVSIQPNLAGLLKGVYTGDLTINISSASATTPQTVHVEVLLLVLPAGATLPAQPTGESAPLPHASGCTPTQLLPVFTLLGTGFLATAGWPTAIAVTVVDDCGNPLISGSVTVTFSSGDPALSLASIGGGNWTATWNATHSTNGLTITAEAQETQPALSGTASIGGTLKTNSATPIVSTGGVVSAANFVGNQPLAPGTFAAIFGSNLGQGLLTSNQLPLSNQLGNTSVVLGGEQLPLLFTSGGQVNVVVPYDVPVNSTLQLVVQNGSAISLPQSVVIAPALPAIFTQNGFGTGAALTNVFKPDGTPLANNSPVGAGYVIVLYCSGLGAVNPPVAAGSAAPSSPLSQTVNPVTATIGGLPAPVFFAGLTPGYAELYQVNVVIPSGLPSGSATLTLSEAGQQSAPVTITIQ